MHAFERFILANILTSSLQVATLLFHGTAAVAVANRLEMGAGFSVGQRDGHPLGVAGRLTMAFEIFGIHFAEQRHAPPPRAKPPGPPPAPKTAPGHRPREKSRAGHSPNSSHGIMFRQTGF